MRDNYEKRKFVEAASMAVLLGATMSGKTMTARSIVNQAGELWDELEAQLPTKDKDQA